VLDMLERDLLRAREPDLNMLVTQPHQLQAPLPADHEDSADRLAAVPADDISTQYPNGGSLNRNERAPSGGKA
jgi:hypothetical protein